MLKEMLKTKLDSNEFALVPSSFDVIGSREKAVAIIEIPEGLEKKKKLIAEALMEKHRNVKCVLEKASPRKGTYRTRELKIISGDKDTEVMHKESGCSFLLDPCRVYFSPREGTERLRIAELMLLGETVMVFFAGVGPFSIIIEKKAKPSGVIGIEINPDAYEYFKRNIALNKCKNIQAILGDVKQKAKAFYGTCDRVLMPLPESAVDYLEEAMLCLKKTGVVHLFCFSEEGKMESIYEKIRLVGENIGKNTKILHIHKVLPYGPGIWKYRVDVYVS